MKLLDRILDVMFAEAYVPGGSSIPRATIRIPMPRVRVPAKPYHGHLDTVPGAINPFVTSPTPR